MKVKLNNFIHSKTFIIILIVLLIIITSFTGTYAWFTWNSVDNTQLTMTIGNFADVLFTNGNDITTQLKPVFNYFDGEKTTFAINNRSASGEMITYSIKLNISTITTELRSSDVKYSLVQNGELVITGDLSNAIDGSTIEVFTGAMSSGVTNCELYLYIDGNVENDSSMMNKTIIGNISIEANEFTGTLTELITNLYTISSKNIVTNNSIEYNYASSANLMNDRLGGTTEDYNLGNIRYYGNNPTNYIDVGDRDSLGNIIPWRIIGIFKNVELEDGSTSNLIKVVREAAEVSASWDTSVSTINSGYGINEWSQADLMKLLNPGHESETIGGSLYYTSGSGNCYAGQNNETITCDFSSIGLSDEVKNKIETVMWNTGGHTYSNIYANNIYTYERGDSLVIPGTTCSGDDCNDEVTRTSSWKGEIALIYPSDYAYATNFNYCSVQLEDFSINTCKNNDWLYIGKAQLLLTPADKYAPMVWGIYPEGSLKGIIPTSTKPLSFRPTLFLKNNLTITAGDGTKNNPYVIA